MLALLAAAALDVPPAGAHANPVAPRPAIEAPVDPAALAAATKLLAAMHVDETIDRMLGTLAPMMSTAVLGSLEHEAATQGTMRAIESQPDGRTRMMTIFSEELMKSLRARYPAIIASAAREYATVFSAQELEQLGAFFATGTGAKWVNLSPQLQKSVAAKAGKIGGEAGVEAGTHAINRAVREILPPTNAAS